MPRWVAVPYRDGFRIVDQDEPCRVCGLPLPWADGYRGRHSSEQHALLRGHLLKMVARLVHARLTSQ